MLICESEVQPSLDETLGKFDEEKKKSYWKSSLQRSLEESSSPEIARQLRKGDFPQDVHWDRRRIFASQCGPEVRARG